MVSFAPLLTDPEEVSEVVDNARREIRYVITDFSFELVVQKFRAENPSEGDIYIPDYQRNLAWNPEKQSYFVESLILRIPVPPLFFYEISGRLEIVDGSQRIRSIVNFSRGDFRLVGLEKLDILNGFLFSDLPRDVQRRLNNTPVRSFVLDEGTDAGTRMDLFRRLNTSGKKLEDAEIRKGVFRGPFLDLVIECAASKLFHEVTPYMGRGVDAESERQELVTRFFIYKSSYKDFRHDVRKFLDARMAAFNEQASAEQLTEMRNDFDRTMSFIKENYPKGFYRTDTGKLVPRVRFEAVSVGTALALEQKADVVVRDTSWLRSKEFNQLVRTDASNSGPKLRSRVEFVRDKLLGE